MPPERPHKNPYSNSYYSKQLHSGEDALPGTQKLKSSLRQSKRLLAKDSLAADVRVETERRLRAVEADLARAKQSQKERHHAAKYHKVKFFERKKIVRKIKQIKRSIETLQGKEKKILESTLTDLRVDLNYILHFPKTEKYISLFPPEVRGSGSSAAPVVASSDDNEMRSKVRERIRHQMEHGELSTEPENKPWKPGRENKPTWGAADVGPSIKPTRTPADGVTDDDFFGDDAEEDGEASDS